jgi:O-antigen/teichoic acid export membrane protein
MQDDPGRLWNTYLRAISAVSLVAYPIFMGLAVVSPEAVRVVFGSQWDQAVLPLEYLCIGGVFWSITTLSDQVAHGTGAVYRMFGRRIVYAVTIFAGALIGSQRGIDGVAIGVAFALLLMYFLMAQLCLHLTRGNWREFAVCQIPGLSVAAVTTSVAYATVNILRANGFSPLTRLVLTIAATGAVFVVTLLVVPRAWLPESCVWSLTKIEAQVARAARALHGRGFPVPFMAAKVGK